VSGLEPGSTLGAYEILARLRAGAMGVLFLAKRVGPGGFARPVAIKVIHDHLAQNKRFARMFVDEAKLSAQIDDPNVVRVEEFGEAGGRYYLVMEYVHGASLAQVIALLRQRGGIPIEIAVAIAMQMSAGLHGAHEATGSDGLPLGIVHRDVSPHNVLVSYKGAVRVIDFGIAKARQVGGQTKTGSLRGKLAYMPPEQARSARTVDRRADLYCVGLVLWEMLTGRRLFDAESDIAILNMIRSPVIVPPSTQRQGVPPALDELVMRTLSQDPAGRPETGAVLQRLLGEALPAARGVLNADIAALMSKVKDAANAPAKAPEKKGEKRSEEEAASALYGEELRRSLTAVGQSVGEAIDEATLEQPAHKGGTAPNVARDESRPPPARATDETVKLVGPPVDLEALLDGVPAEERTKVMHPLMTQPSASMPTPPPRRGQGSSLYVPTPAEPVKPAPPPSALTFEKVRDPILMVVTGIVLGLFVAGFILSSSANVPAPRPRPRVSPSASAAEGRAMAPAPTVIAPPEPPPAEPEPSASAEPSAKKKPAPRPSRCASGAARARRCAEPVADAGLPRRGRTADGDAARRLDRGANGLGPRAADHPARVAARLGVGLEERAGLRRQHRHGERDGARREVLDGIGDRAGRGGGAERDDARAVRSEAQRRAEHPDDVLLGLHAREEHQRAVAALQRAERRAQRELEALADEVLLRDRDGAVFPALPDLDRDRRDDLLEEGLRVEQHRGPGDLCVDGHRVVAVRGREQALLRRLDAVARRRLRPRHLRLAHGAGGLGGRHALLDELAHSTDLRDVFVRVEPVRRCGAARDGHAVAALPRAQRGRVHAAQVGGRVDPIGARAELGGANHSGSSLSNVLLHVAQIRARIAACSSCRRADGSRGSSPGTPRSGSAGPSAASSSVGSTRRRRAWPRARSSSSRTTPRGGTPWSRWWSRSSGSGRTRTR
jgi:eukaryotic-like serine/threonine-protein kinase